MAIHDKAFDWRVSFSAQAMKVAAIELFGKWFRAEFAQQFMLADLTFVPKKTAKPPGISKS